MLNTTAATNRDRKGQTIMKKTLKKILAIMIALMMAMPGTVFADDVIITDVAIGENGASYDDGIVIEKDLVGQGDLTIDGGIELGDMPDLNPRLAANEPQEADVAPFEQSAMIGGVEFTMTAAADAFPAGAVLSVAEADADVAQAAIQSIEAALGGEATHHIYSIQVLDAAGKPLSPNAGLELPLVRVKGLDIVDGVRVFVYDQNLDGN